MKKGRLNFPFPEHRLLDHATQEAYFGQITARYESLYGRLPTPGEVVTTSSDDSAKLASGSNGGSSSSDGGGHGGGKPSASDSLATAMAGLDIDTTPLSGYKPWAASSTASAASVAVAAKTSMAPTPRGSSGGPGPASNVGPVPATSAATGGAVGILVTAMRGLREGLLASGRADGFAVAAYTFVVRAGIATAGYETYVPALTQLLGRVYEQQQQQQQQQRRQNLKQKHHLRGRGESGSENPGPREEEEEEEEIEKGKPDDGVVMGPELVRELVAYHILDLACRRSAYADALAARAAWRRKMPELNENGEGLRGLEDSPEEGSIVDAVLWALIRGDWIGFWAAKRRADGFQKKLIEMAEDRMRRHAIECLAKTYFTVSREYVKTCTGESIDSLRDGEEVQWEVEGNAVVIRRITKSR